MMARPYCVGCNKPADVIRNLLFRLLWHSHLDKHKAELINAIDWHTCMIRMRGSLWLATLHWKHGDNFIQILEDR